MLHKKKTFIYVLITFILSFITKIVYLLHPINIRMVSDNFGCLIGSAYLAGLDWRHAAPGNYYGQGWYIIYSFLFRFVEDPYLIYQIIIITNIIIISSVSILIYFILVGFLDIKNGILPVLLSALCTHFMLDHGYGTRISNESPVFVFTWLIYFFLLYTYFNKGKKKFIYGFSALIFIQSYSLLIHTRMSVLIIAIFLCILLFQLLYNEWIINPVLYILSTLAGSIIVLRIKHYITSILWKNNVPEEILNYNLGVDRVLKADYTIKSIMDVLISNIYKLTISTDGLFLIGIIIFSALLWKVFKKIVKNSSLSIPNYKDTAIFIMFITSFLCVAICICGICVLYSDEIAKGYALQMENARFNGLTYLRYYFSFSGPMLLSIILISNNKKKYVLKYYKWIFPVWIFVLVYEYLSVIPKLDIYLSSFSIRNYISNPRINIILTVIFISVCLVICWLLIYKKKIILLTGFMILQFFYTGLCSLDFPFLQISSTAGDKTYALINCIKDDFYFSKSIYTYKSKNSEIQFLLNEYKVIVLKNLVDINSIDAPIIITGVLLPEESEYLFQTGYTQIISGENENIWSNAPELLKYTRN